MKALLQPILMAIVALTAAGTATAEVVGNGPPDISFASNLNEASVPLADRFTVTTAGSASALQFWAIADSLADYSSPSYWAIYTDVLSNPGISLGSGTAAFSGVAAPAFDISGLGLAFSFTASVAGPVLAPGNYWLALHNGALATDPGTVFNWAWASPTGNSRFFDPLSSTWVDNSAALAFTVTTDAIAVPLPPSFGLMIAGLLGGWMVLRQRRGTILATSIAA